METEEREFPAAVFEELAVAEHLHLAMSEGWI